MAHVDYVRSVRIEPLAPERTRLVAEWHFSAGDAGAAGLRCRRPSRPSPKIVMAQDGAASEMNQRGMRSPAFRAARLMPEEYEIHRFHQWVLNEMETHA